MSFHRRCRDAFSAAQSRASASPHAQASAIIAKLGTVGFAEIGRSDSRCLLAALSQNATIEAHGPANSRAQRSVILRREVMRWMALGPGPRHATIGNSYAASLFSDNHTLDITASTSVIADAMGKARNGDKSLASDILAAQAVALDTMFTELAHRSAAYMGQYLDASERYMRLALKAQANCRATLEALAKLHQPREQIVEHVHVNEGGQAIVADHIHQHSGGEKMEKTANNPMKPDVTPSFPPAGVRVWRLFCASARLKQWAA